MKNFYGMSDYKTWLYAICRVGLGGYLLVHSIMGILNFNEFMVLALSYVQVSSPLSFLAYLTPIVPFMEFFLALMITMGLYTKIAMKWAIGLGIFFMFFFQFTGDMASALEHSYGVTVKVVLLFGIYYNKFSVDYYNLYVVDKEVQAIRQKFQ